MVLDLEEKSLFDEGIDKATSDDYIIKIDYGNKTEYAKDIKKSYSKYLQKSIRLRDQETLTYYFSNIQVGENKPSQNHEVYERSQLNIGKLQEKYSISKSEMPKLRRFLEKNLEILPILSEAYQKIKAYFPDEEIRLEVTSDVEDNNCEILFAYILTKLSVEEAHQKLDDLDEEWYLDQSEEIQELFNLNFKFI